MRPLLRDSAGLHNNDVNTVPNCSTGGSVKTNVTRRRGTVPSFESGPVPSALASATKDDASVPVSSVDVISPKTAMRSAWSSSRAIMTRWRYSIDAALACVALGVSRRSGMKRTRGIMIPREHAVR